MATFIGTNANETITATLVSPTVTAIGGITPGAGGDIINAGGGDDILNGDGGDDQLFGDAGNDRMIWTAGGGTDLFEGGADEDTAEINGGSGGEAFTVTANGARVRFDRLNPDAFSLDIGTTERLVLNMGGGNDVLSTTGNLAALISITVDGGAGNDVIFGSNGVDRLLGGIGDDFIDGQQGNDRAFLGDGNDVFQWDPGDGSDVIEGQTGTDTLLFNGSAGNEIFAASANGARVLFARNLGNITMDINDVERLDLNALGGTDEIIVNSLTATDLTNINVNLSGTIGGTAGDAAVDTVRVNGSAAANSLSLSTIVNRSNVNVLVAELVDTVTVQALAGNDTIEVGRYLGAIAINGGTQIDTVTYLQATAGVGVNLINPASNGGAAVGHTYVSIENVSGSTRNDLLTGNNAANILNGRAGNDTLMGGLGNDVLIGDAGRDTMTGQAGSDIFRFLNKTHSFGANTDTITDFDDGGTGDRIDVSALFGAPMTYRHNLAFTAAGQVRVLDVTGPDVIVHVNTGGSLAADFQLRLKATTLASMAANDFVL
ncbi:MAG TPA: calcium-binding protein [Rhizobiaceae bacterium]|nr:calcium-binding protein [Rhizobiaceae bacterium]